MLGAGEAYPKGVSMTPALRLRSFVLALSLSLLGTPAFAAPRAQAAPETPLARGIILRVLYILNPVLEKLGAGMEPLD
jgi:hypothetical protein